jgi:hypothetical protein
MVLGSVVGPDPELFALAETELYPELYLDPGLNPDPKLNGKPKVLTDKEKKYSLGKKKIKK